MREPLRTVVRDLIAQAEHSLDTLERYRQALEVITTFEVFPPIFARAVEDGASVADARRADAAESASLRLPSPEVELSVARILARRGLVRAALEWEDANPFDEPARRLLEESLLSACKAFRTARAALLSHVEFPELALYCLNAAEPWVLAPEGAYPSINLARRHPAEGEPSAVAGSLTVAQITERLAEARATEIELRRANQELAEKVRRLTADLEADARWKMTAATAAEHLRPFFKGHVGADNVVWAAEHVAEMLDEVREQAKDARAEAVLSAAEAAAYREARAGLLLRGEADRAREALADFHPRAQQIAAQSRRLEQLGPLLRAVMRWARGTSVNPRELLNAVEQAFSDGLLDGLEG